MSEANRRSAAAEQANGRSSADSCFRRAVSISIVTLRALLSAESRTLATALNRAWRISGLALDIYEKSDIT